MHFVRLSCRAEDYEDIEEFGNARKEWLEKFLELPNGIPDKDNAPLNWNVMRKTALPLLRNSDVGKKQSIKRKMFMATLDVSILENILF